MVIAGSSIAGIVAAVLLGLYLIVRRTHWTRNNLFLGLALSICAFLEFFDLLAFLYPASLAIWKNAALWCEALIVPSWILLGLEWCGSLPSYKKRTLDHVLLILSPIFIVYTLLVPSDKIFFNPDFASETVLFLGRAGYFFYFGIVLYLTYALVLLERSLSSFVHPIRWQVKFEIIGIGTVIAAQLFYYSQGLLYRSIDFSLLPVRSLGLCIGVILMVFSRSRKGSLSHLGMSRAVAYRSVVILAVGIYLVGLGLAGEGMRYLGPYSQRYFVGVLALIGGVLLVVVFLSETIRRKIRVLINKHFYRDKYDYRTQWLGFTQRLSHDHHLGSPAENILAFFCDTFSIRGALLYLRSFDNGEFSPQSAYNCSMPTESLRGKSPLVTRLIDSHWVLDVDALDAEILQESQPLLAKEEIRFIVPLFVDDALEGVILLGRPIDAKEIFSFEDYDLMKVMAAQAVAVLHNQRLGDQLSRAREMEAIGKVAAFVMHDLKNTVSNIALVVENGRHYMNDPEFQKDMLETLDKSVKRMKGLIERLKNFEDKRTLKKEQLDLSTLVSEVMDEIPNRNILFSGSAAACYADKSEISKVVVNLLLNALDATGGMGPVYLEVGQDEMVFLRCRDQGVGMPAEFLRNKLFKPFETTKNDGFGIGLYQCRQIIEAHGGKISVESVEEQGTTFTVWLPGAKAADV